jgi:hypothetical protein
MTRNRKPPLFPGSVTDKTVDVHDFYFKHQVFEVGDTQNIELNHMEPGGTAARARIAAAQRERWAKAKAQKTASIAPKRKMSPAAIARIRAAQKAR